MYFSAAIALLCIPGPLSHPARVFAHSETVRFPNIWAALCSLAFLGGNSLRLGMSYFTTKRTVYNLVGPTG